MIESEAGRRANVSRPLTRSLDLGEEGLAMNATQCEHCRASIAQPRPGKRFCSGKCRTDATCARRRAERRDVLAPFICINCDGVIQRRRGTGRFPKFCGRPCVLEYQRKERRQERLGRGMTCQSCGATIAERGDQRFCSRRCSYQARARRAGRKPVPPAEERFWSRVEKEPGPCWVWTGGSLASGYGSFRAGGAAVAHRYAWTLLCGPIASGLQLDHLCRNRRCVNPDHLEPVTQQENLRRARLTAEEHAALGGLRLIAILTGQQP